MEAAEQEIRLAGKSAYHLKVSVKLTADALMLLAVLTFFTNENFFMFRCIPFIGLSLIVTFPLIWMGLETSRKFNKTFTGIGLTLFLTGQLFLGIPWWLSILILFLLHWRVSTHLEEERNSRYEMAGGYMLGLMIVSLISYAYQNIYEKQPTEFILVIFLCGMLFYTAGTYIVRYTESTEHSKRSTRMRSAKLPVVYGGILVTLAAGTAFLNGTVSGLLNKMFEWFFWLLSFLIDPIWKLVNWFLSLLPKSVSEGWETLRRPDKKRPYEITPEQLENGGELSFSWWNEALIGILLLVIVFYVWRRFRNNGWSGDDDTKRYACYSSFKEAVLPDGDTQTVNIPYSSPDSEIRKGIFSLEKRAEGKGMPRQNGETIQEWFTRLGFQEDQEFYRVYEAARYGNKQITDDKLALFKQGVERVAERIENEDS
jgi:hypothetical protein